MLQHQGIPVSPGIAIGPAVVLNADNGEVNRTVIGPAQVPAELERLEQALQAARAEILAQKEATTQALGPELGAIFGFHDGMLQDRHLLDQIRNLIRQEAVACDYAVFAVFEKLAETFLAQENPYFRERVTDLTDLKRRLLRALRGEKETELDALTAPGVLVAHDLTPGQTAGLDKSKIRAIVTEVGGRTSHTAILAHALGIPCVVGIAEITALVRQGENLIVDGHEGLVVASPDAGQLLNYRDALRRETAVSAARERVTHLPAETRDGTAVNLLANIEFPDEIPGAIAKGAKGVGLFRTEYLYLGALTEPDEESQYEAYREAIEFLDGRPLTIRTLDLGADKADADIDALRRMPPEHNPFLGCRSIRLCLQDLALFRTQLRAILRASAHGPVSIMFPLISHVGEVRQARMVLRDAMDELQGQGLSFDPKVKVGMMVEVPSAAIQAAAFAKEVDFFSIGTNDLVQYTVAVDRGNERIAGLYSDSHPAVLALVRDVIRAAQRAKIDVSLCGEMAGDPLYIPLLLGLGLRNFSITPPAIPEAKELIRGVGLDRCRRIARKALSFATDREVSDYLYDELDKIREG